MNGSWLSIGTVKTSIPDSDPNSSTQTFTIPCNDIYAHEFRIHFSVNKWVFANNLQVLAANFATPQPGQTTHLPAVQNYPNAPLHVFDSNDHGIHDMLLVYTGAHGSLGTWSQADFKPMVTYVSQDGQIGGRMFDTMLFLPYAGLANTQVAWSGYVNQLFRSTSNLAALDASTSAANQSLQQLHFGNGQFKENVVIALPYPSVGNSTWGTVDGNSISFAGSSTDDDGVQARAQALQWYVNDVLNRWKAANYTHLNLVGFYWLSEQVNYAHPGEADLIEQTSSMIHELGYPLFWIPSYDASGFADWKSLGFDASWLQSHFVFMGVHAPLQRLQNSAALATQYGTGIEVEVPDNALGSAEAQRQYVQSIKEFKQLGMHDNVSHAFYAGSKLLVRAAQSTNPGVRRLYDETYAIKNY